MLNDVLTFRHTLAKPSRGAIVRRGWYYGPNFREKSYDVRPMAMPIPYAPPLPWHRRRRTQTLILRLVILAALLCGTAWLFRFAQQLQFLAQQHSWMTYSLPADKIVLAERTVDVPALLKTPGYMAEGPNAVALQPPRWSCKAGDLCYPFIHARRATGRSARLVAIIAIPNFNQRAGMNLALFASAEIPAGLLPGDRPLDACGTFGSGHLLFPLHSALRIFAGQPDPADESHFTIRCEIDGKSLTVDGWLMPEDTVKLEPRE
jgi:hypothetical protein